MSRDGITAGVSARFSAAAPTYDAHAGLQEASARKLFDFLAALDPPRRILDVGCGTGILTRLLAERFPLAAVDAIDIAPGMIEEALRRGPEGRVSWHVGDARAFSPPDPCDLIAANCSLHWLEPLRGSLSHLAAALAPAGSLAASVVLRGTLAELHAARLRAAPGKPPLEGLPTPAALRDALERAGLCILHFEEEEVSSACPSVERLLLDLRSLGVTSGRVSRGALPLSRGEIRRLIEEYEAGHRVPGGIRVTYRLAYFVASRRASRAPVGEPAGNPPR